MIALLASVAAETEILRSAFEKTGDLEVGSLVITHGTLAGKKAALCVGGMGKVNAAHAATIMLTRLAPEALILFGVGGAYPSSGAAVGDIALAREEIAGDEGVLTQDGFKDTAFIGIPLLKTASATVFNTFPASAVLLDRAVASIRSMHLADAVHVGSFVTLSTCTGTAARARELEVRYQGLCENMEGAATAQVAGLHQVPWLEVRGISNLVEDRDLGKWDIPRASRAAQRAVIGILEAWKP